MRSVFATAVLAGVLGPLATTAFAADLDYYPDAPPPPPVYEPHPVPPAYVPGPPVVVYPRRIVRPVRVFPRPYPYYDGRRPVVRAYGEPRPYAEGYERPYPREARPDPYDAPRHVARGYGEPRPDVDGYDRPYPSREPEPYYRSGPGYGYSRE